jgi:hypothetical protein
MEGSKTLDATFSSVNIHLAAVLLELLNCILNVPSFLVIWIDSPLIATSLPGSHFGSVVDINTILLVVVICT